MNNQSILNLIEMSQFNVTKKKTVNELDWNSIYAEAVSQAVIGVLAYEVPKDVLLVDPCWQQAIYRQQAHYVRYLRAEDELKSIMDAAGIPFVILKGNAAAIYYKHPERRNMGDIDFLVPQSKYEVAKAVLKENGYILDDHGKNPRHIGYKKNGVSFELHHHFSHEEVDIEEYVIEGLKNRVIGKIGKHEFPMLPPMANGLVLLDHMKSHLKSGMGLRQIIDWMMYVNAELHDDSWKNGFETVAKKKGFRKFAMVATKMCQRYLGLPCEDITWCSDADDVLCDRLMAIVMSSGNFGMKNGNGTSIECVTTRFRRDGVFRYMQERGELHWEAYKKHHWLKPFCWIYQLFRYIRRGLKTGRSRKQMSEDVKRSKERAEVLKEMGI